MTTPLDLTGSVFGELTALEKDGKKWLCLCSCGKKKLVALTHLRSGATRSCGHLIGDATRRRCTKHGHKRRGHSTRTYSAWEAMRRRCNNRNQKSWANYGGRGITVCERWESYETFLRDMGECQEGMSLERLDVDKSYSPENCCWIPRRRQARNKTNTLRVEYKGQSKCLADWAEDLGILYGTLYNRLYRYGWTVERAFR